MNNLLIDRESVILLLDKKDKGYESSLITLNTLPPDAIFEVELEDIVTAEYYDEAKDEVFQFVLGYDYFTTNKTYADIEDRRLQMELYKSMSEQEHAPTKDKMKRRKLVIDAIQSIGIAALCIILVLAIFYVFL